MNIRWTAAVITLLVTLFILFGGFWGYQWWRIERPIEETVRQTPQVTLHQLTVEPDRVTIDLKATSRFSLTTDYVSLRNRVKPLIGDRKLIMQVQDRPDPILAQTWNEMVFGITEGMAHQRYTQIPKAVEQAAEPANIRYRTAMDEEFVYIELHHKHHYLYRVLPLHKPHPEVKDNG